MEFNHDIEEILIGNYWYLFYAYRRGNFEMAVDSSRFKFYQPLKERKVERYPTIKPAADDLVALVSSLSESIRTNALLLTDKQRECLAEYDLRIKVLSYEIDDYFLVVSPEKSARFISMAEGVTDDLLGFYEQYYSFVSGQSTRGKILQYLLLSALCGVNEVYRQHNQESYSKCKPPEFSTSPE